MSELSRLYDARHLPAAPQSIIATPAECAALARRFGLVAIDRLAAQAELSAAGKAVRAAGRVDAAIIQSCAVSGDDLPVTIAEPFALRFVPPRVPAPGADEIELSADELDEIEMDGTQFDLGEAIAQTLALAIDPYAVGPRAEEARRRAGIVSEGSTGPFAALKGLLDKT